MTQPLSYLSDKLPVESVTFSILRQDELSGSGDGQIWQAQMAPPIWQAEIVLTNVRDDCARAIRAAVNGLNGSAGDFLLEDRACRYPLNDPLGAVVAGASPVVAAIGANRQSLGVTGLPANYKLAAGDKLTVVFGSAVYLGEVSANVTASGAGAATVPVFPPVPYSAAASSQPVVLVRPYMKARLATGGWTRFTMQRRGSRYYGFGGAISAVQVVK
ncbi:MAG: hypothetical protein IE922_01495 [Sphingomonadales bacterium]|nr:hypothetical protein [Sphingomonadales bacterium]